MPLFDLGRGKKSDTDSVHSQERGRPMVATGRGGAGNEENTPQNAPHIMHVGRGGMGNVRSPSRDPLDRKRKEEEEQQLDQLQTAELKQGMHSTGRGGRGNIPLGEQEERGRRQSPGNTRVAGVLRSLSRSRSRDPGDSSRREASRTRGTPLNQVMEDE